MSRADLVWLVKYRNIVCGNEKTLSVASLIALLGNITPDENAALSAYQKLRNECTKKITPTQVDKALELSGIARSGLTLDMKLDIIIEKAYRGDRLPPRRPPIILDKDQRKALNAIRSKHHCVVSAGPGAGKTTFLCAAAHATQTTPDGNLARVLMLAFNRVAAAELTERLKKLGVSLVTRRNVMMCCPGVSVLTFDAFGYRIMEKKRSLTQGVPNLPMLVELGLAPATPAIAAIEELTRILITAPGVDDTANIAAHIKTIKDHGGLRMLTSRAPAAVRTLRTNLPPDLRDQLTDDTCATRIAGATEKAPPHEGFRVSLERAAKAAADVITQIIKDLRGPPPTTPTESTESTTPTESTESTTPTKMWDWLIVDEAQDVTETHAKLITAILPVCGNVLIAGDPRQELYPGATWFSHLWSTTPAADRMFLRYNHRSTPQIVTFLNQYSRTNFPTLHHDQIAVRTQNGPPVRFIIPETSAKRKDWRTAQQARLTAEGTAAAEFMAAPSTHPVTAYAIAPVTIEKWNMTTVQLAIREVMFERTGNTVHVCAPNGTPAPIQSMSIGTSTLLKGTERDRVAVIGATVPYTKHGQSTESVSKMLFVALSRARNELLIVGTACPPGHQLSFIAPIKIKQTSRPAPPDVPQISVTDLVKYTEISSQSGLADACPTAKITGPATNRDSDVLGINVEMCTARALGIWTPEHTHKIINALGVPTFYRAPDGTFIYTAPAATDIAARAAPDLAPELFHAITRHSCAIGRRWTVSDYLQDRQPEIQANTPALVQQLIRLMGSDIEYQTLLTAKSICHRAPTTAATLIGITDFISHPRGIVVEMKHTSKTTAAHATQAAIYAAMCRIMFGREYRAYVCNTQEGTLTQVNAIPIQLILDITRAHIGMKDGRICPGHRFHGGKLHPPACITPECMIAVDIETSLDGEITEVGAVAFNTFGVLAVYHHIPDNIQDATATRPSTPSTDNSRNHCFTSMTALCRTEGPTPDTILNTKHVFRHWVEQISGRRCFLQWAGHDTSALEIADLGESIDVASIHRTWTRKHGLGGRVNHTLEGAIRHMLGPRFVFKPHRAFEDAVATAVMLMATVIFDGAV